MSRSPASLVTASVAGAESWSSTYFFVAATFGLVGFAGFVIRLSDIVRSFVGFEEPSSLRYHHTLVIPSYCFVKCPSEEFSNLLHRHCFPDFQDSIFFVH